MENPRPWHLFSSLGCGTRGSICATVNVAMPRADNNCVLHRLPVRNTTAGVEGMQGYLWQTCPILNHLFTIEPKEKWHSLTTLTLSFHISLGEKWAIGIFPWYGVTFRADLIDNITYSLYNYMITSLSESIS